MICPSCGIAFHPGYEHESGIFNDTELASDEGVQITGLNCPECSRLIVVLLDVQKVNKAQAFSDWYTVQETVIYPKSSGRNLASDKVPSEFKEDYEEAAIVIQDSPKASAALSRRCLQNLIREKAGIIKHTLAAEIEALLSSNTLPSHIAEAVDAVRNIGNLAAHPTKNEHTGEIVPVEPGEAEWLLEVLEALFDFYFVQPAKLEERKNALNAKLEQLGKPPMKSPKNDT